MFHSVLIKRIGLKGVYSTYEVIFIRSLVVIAVLAPFFLFKKVKFIEKKNIHINLLFAFFSIIGSYCWHYGLSMVPVNNATIMNFFIPMVIPVVAVVLLKERLSYTLIFSILVCFATIIYFYKPQAIWNLGYFLLLADVFSYSLSIGLSKKLMIKKQSPVAILFFKVIVVSITSLHCIPNLSVKIAEQPVLLLPTLLVGISYLCENLLFFTAYMLVAVSKLQPLYYTRIVFAAIISYLILNEQLSYTQVIVASVIILVNINLIRVERKRKSHDI